MSDTDLDNKQDGAVMDEWAEALAEAGSGGGAQATPAGLENLVDEGRPKASDDVNLEVILDIPVTISMEVGSTKINIRNLLQLNQGSVIELDRMAGEPLDIKVNGTLIAHGEVVVVNEKFGIRLTDVISPAERVKKLK
jgi:flagellar motor switch protein FliN/FliY